MFSLPANAQQGIKSGSLQIIDSSNETVLAEITGPQFFNEMFAGNIILSNLMPGEYTVRIYSLQARGRQSSIVNQAILVKQGQRTIITISRNRVSTKTIYDENSQYIYMNIVAVPQNPPYFSIDQRMSEREFNQLYNSVEKAIFDNNKFKIVDAAADHSMFCTSQIRQIMKLFSFEDGKLDCAKTMSKNATDRQNLYSLADEFTFSATKEKYLDYLKRHR